MDHFSEFWIVAIITWVFIGKRVICTPYIPVSTPKNYEHVLFVHVRDEHIGKVKVFCFLIVISSSSSFLLGDLNFRAPGEHRFQIGRPLLPSGLARPMPTQSYSFTCYCQLQNHDPTGQNLQLHHFVPKRNLHVSTTQ